MGQSRLTVAWTQLRIQISRAAESTTGSSADADIFSAYITYILWISFAISPLWLAGAVNANMRTGLES